MAPEHRQSWIRTPVRVLVFRSQVPTPALAKLSRIDVLVIDDWTMASLSEPVTTSWRRLHRLPYPRAASYNSAPGRSVQVRMAVYVRVVEPGVKGAAVIQEHIEQVYSPDHATAFTYDEAQFYRQKAFENWPNFNWEIEKLGGDKYRVRAIRLAAS